MPRVLRNHTPYLVVVTLYLVAGLLARASVGKPLPYSIQEAYGGPVTLALSYLGITFFLQSLAMYSLPGGDRAV